MISAYIFVFLLLILFSFNQLTLCLDNGLAKTPPMGWMHWERYQCTTDCEKYPDDCISEKLFQRMSNLLISEGYADVGYEYIIIDDCWLAHARDKKTKKLLPDPKRFPSGMKDLSDYIHTRNLKFGLYQDFGINTCEGYPGIIGHMELDAQTFADWEVDYVKLDACYSENADLNKGFPEFGRLLNKTGRPMVYSCSWPYYQETGRLKPDYDQIASTCNLWRNGPDSHDNYRTIRHIMDYYAGAQKRFRLKAGPGHWNDPDMLIIGNFGLSYDQSKLQMAIWAILAAPLIMSNNLATVRPEMKAILQNRDIIAVNQDPLGIQGYFLRIDNNIEVWMRPITPITTRQKYSFAVALVNRREDNNVPYPYNFVLEDIGLTNTRGYDVVDLFESRGLGFFMPHDDFKTIVNPKGVTFFKFIAV